MLSQLVDSITFPQLVQLAWVFYTCRKRPTDKKELPVLDMIVEVNKSLKNNNCNKQVGHNHRWYLHKLFSILAEV